MAGRFDGELLNRTSSATLIQNLKRTALQHDIHKSVVSVKNKHFEFAAVYIGNRMLLTAAHCIEDDKPKGFHAHFTTYQNRNNRLMKKTLLKTKVLNWTHVKNYDLGFRDYGVILLDKDPKGIKPVKLAQKPSQVKREEGLLISPFARIDFEHFHQYDSYVTDVKGGDGHKHAFYTNLYSGNHLPSNMRVLLEGDKKKSLTAIMEEGEAYQAPEGKIFGKTRPGDSGSPIFVKRNGEYQLLALVSGGYSWAYGVKARELADLYVDLRQWKRNGKLSLRSLSQKLVKPQLKKEQKKLKTLKKKKKKHVKKKKRKVSKKKKIMKRKKKAHNKFKKAVRKFHRLVAKFKKKWQSWKKKLFNFKAKKSHAKKTKAQKRKYKKFIAKLKAKIKRFKKRFKAHSKRLKQNKKKERKAHKAWKKAVSAHKKAKRDPKALRKLKAKLRAATQSLNHLKKAPKLF